MTLFFIAVFFRDSGAAGQCEARPGLDIHLGRKTPSLELIDARSLAYLPTRPALCGVTASEILGTREVVA